MNKLLPFLLSVLVFCTSYNAMYIFTEKMWQDPASYCKENATTREYNTCTRFTALGGFMIIIVPVLSGLGIFIITDYTQKKEEELIIK